MPDSSMSFLQHVCDTLDTIVNLFIVALPAGLGGLLHAVWEKKNWKEVMTEALVALYTGYIVVSLLQGVQIGEGMKGAIIAGSGWGSGKIIHTITYKLMQRGGIPYDREEKEEDKSH